MFVCYVETALARSFYLTTLSIDKLPRFHGQYCAGGKIETNEMGRACGAYGGG